MSGNRPGSSLHRCALCGGSLQQNIKRRKSCAPSGHNISYGGHDHYCSADTAPLTTTAPPITTTETCVTAETTTEQTTITDTTVPVTITQITTTASEVTTAPTPAGPYNGQTSGDYIYVNGFGWVFNEGGGGYGETNDEMYCNGNKIGYFG